MAIIKLTYRHCDGETFPVFLNSHYIVTMCRGYDEDATEIKLSAEGLEFSTSNPYADEMHVTEKPEEILNLINGLELSKQKA